jgi:hypothetical protein
VEHPSNEVLMRFANGKASRKESRGVVAHLLKSCRSCQEKIKAFLEPHPVARGAHEEVLDRFQEGLARKLDEGDETDPKLAPPVPGSPSGRPAGRRPWRRT